MCIMETLTDAQKLKVTVLCDVRKICQEVGSRLKNQVTFDSQALELISEMVWHKIQDFGADLELFARHAKRTFVNIEDVKLLVRKNQHLKDHVVKLSDEISASSSSKRKKKEKDSDNVTNTGPGDVAVTDDMMGNFDIIDLDD